MRFIYGLTLGALAGGAALAGGSPVPLLIAGAFYWLTAWMI